MKNNDEIQYIPIRGRVEYSDEEFKTTNVKNNGSKKGTVKWNYKRIATTMILAGTVFAVSHGAIKGFDHISGTPVETPTQIEQDVLFSEIKEEEKRVVVDYQVKMGDTLDGIIYKYTDNAQEKDKYKREVEDLNNIDNGYIHAGDIITLVGVPESDAEALNTGYDANVTNDDDISFSLNQAVNEMIQLETQDGSVIAKGSLADTIMNEMNVYNQTTNVKTRSYLAKRILLQIEEVRDLDSSVEETQGAVRK